MASENLLRADIATCVLEARSDAIVACDRDGVIRFWNPGATRIFGFAEDEVVGRSLDIIIPERLRSRHWDGFQAMISTGQSRYGEGHVLSVPGCRKDGSQVSAEFTINVLKDNTGSVTHLVAIMRDVTERFEEMKMLRSKLREKTVV